MGQAHGCPGSSGGRQDIVEAGRHGVCRTWQRREWPSVGKAPGLQEGARGKDQASRTPGGALVLSLADCVALGPLFDLSGLQTKQEKKYKKKRIFLYIRGVCEVPAPL